MSGQIINADVLPRLKGFVVVEAYGFGGMEIDMDLIHPTKEAALSYITEWRHDDDNDDYLICEIDAPLTLVASVLGKDSRDEAESPPPLPNQRTLFAEE